MKVSVQIYVPEEVTKGCVSMQEGSLFHSLCLSYSLPLFLWLIPKLSQPFRAFFWSASPSGQPLFSPVLSISFSLFFISFLFSFLHLFTFILIHVLFLSDALSPLSQQALVHLLWFVNHKSPSLNVALHNTGVCMGVPYLYLIFLKCECLSECRFDFKIHLTYKEQQRAWP